MNLPDDPAASAYSCFELLVQATRSAAAVSERSMFRNLALRCALHPSLKPFRDDPLLPLDGRFISLDAQIGGLTSLSQAATEEPTIGSIGATLYIPALSAARACRVRCCYLPTTPQDRWQDPIPVHPASAELQSSARVALEAARHVLLFVCPGDNPPHPAPVFWGVDGIEEDVMMATTGGSLQLPLTLAFLSALTGLSVGNGVGATGAITPPSNIAPVDFVDEKREAFRAECGDGSIFLTPANGTDVREIASLLGTDWQQRFSTPRRVDYLPLTPGTDPTFVYAGIENAPVLWENHTALFRDACQRFESLFAICMERFGGSPFHSHLGTGEVLGAVFSDPVQATHAAVHLLRAARSVRWGEAFGESLPIRLGIHRGNAEPVEDGWRGIGPAQAYRISLSASAFQILTSEAVHAAVRPPDWICHNKHRLQDLPIPIVLWQVSAPGLKTVTIPPDSLDTRRHNLPSLVTPLFGRDSEIDSLVGLLAREKFITLTGAGGVGKTRLAVVVAERALFAPGVAVRFPDGAFYVALDEESRDESSITDAVCEAVGVPGIGALASKRFLLVLDNAEGVAEIVARFVKSLRSAVPGVVFLVTSRMPIRARGEKRIRVLPPPLPKPDAGLEVWERSAPVQIFLDRAHTVLDSFSISSPEERDALTRLLRRLDCLPLAIELAAARVAHLSVGEIEKRVAESLRLLSTREADVPERHRTLLATLEWSYTQLSGPEKRMLRLMSVFVGGFGLDAAEAVSGEEEALDLLASLEEQSLVNGHRNDKGEPPRFSLLQTVAEFVRGKRSGETGDSNTEREMHARHFVALASRNGGEDVTLSGREVEAFDALDRDMGNLRATWTYLREINDNERSADFAANLSDFLRRRGHARERSEWIGAALAHTEDGDVRRRLLSAHAMTLRDTGRADEAQVIAASLQSLAGSSDNPVRNGDVLALRGSIATRAAQYTEAERFFDEAEILYREAKHKRGTATVLSNRAVNAMRTGDSDRAQSLLESALPLYEEIGDEQGKAYVRNNLGHLLSEKGEYSAAIPHFLGQLTFCRRHSDTPGCAVSLFNLGEALLYTKQEEGLSLVIAAVELFTRLGHPYGVAARTYCEAWGAKTNTAQGTFDALRRAASRRSLAELRESPLVGPG